MNINLTRKDMKHIMNVFALAGAAIEAGIMPINEDGEEIISLKQAEKSWVKSTKTFLPFMEECTKKEEASYEAELAKLPEPLQGFFRDLGSNIASVSVCEIKHAKDGEVTHDPSI